MMILKIIKKTSYLKIIMNNLKIIQKTKNNLSNLKNYNKINNQSRLNLMSNKKNYNQINNLNKLNLMSNNKN